MLLIGDRCGNGYLQHLSQNNKHKGVGGKRWIKNSKNI